MAKKVKDAWTIEQSALDKAIASITKRGKAMVAELHRITCGVMVYTAISGRIDLINKLDKSVPAGFYKTGLRRFIEAKGPVTWTKGDKKAGVEAGFVLDTVKAKALRDEYKADEAKVKADLLSKTFGEFAPEPEYKGFDLEQQAHALLKRAEAVAKDEGKKNDDKTNLSGLSEFRSSIMSIFKKGGTKEQREAA
jgi:hypothetical protein